MTINRTKASILGCAGLAAVASLAIAGAPARAQTAYDQGYAYDQGRNGQSDMSGVTVTAPRRYIGRDAATGADIERVSASRIVDYADLDLSTRRGGRELNARIEHAARAACNELDARYPDATDEEGSCVSTAVRNAMDRVGPDQYAYNTDWRR
jgi:UrcA family protein